MTFSHFSRSVILLVTIALSSGCQLNNWVHNGFKVGPNYCQPAAPVSSEWIDAYDERVRQELPANEDWWYVFNDDNMTRLVYTAYQQNLTLQEAGLRVLQARALRGVAVGGIFPQSQAGFGEYTRTQASRNAFGGPPAGVRAFDNWAAGFDMAWELDVWGKFRRNIEASDADLNASIEDYDDILVTLIAETAATYVEYRTLQQRIAYA
jgi:outer membrane protein TolC